MIVMENIWFNGGIEEEGNGDFILSSIPWRRGRRDGGLLMKNPGNGQSK